MSGCGGVVPRVGGVLHGRPTAQSSLRPKTLPFLDDCEPSCNNKQHDEASPSLWWVLRKGGPTPFCSGGPICTPNYPMCAGRLRESINNSLFVISVSAVRWPSAARVMHWDASQNPTPHSKSASEEGDEQHEEAEGLPMAGDTVAVAAEATKAQIGPCPQHKECRQATHKPKNG